MAAVADVVVAERAIAVDVCSTSLIGAGGTEPPPPRCLSVCSFFVIGSQRIQRDSIDYSDSNTPILKAPKSKAGERVIPILPPLMEILKTAKDQAVGRFLVGDGDCPLTKRAYEWQYRHLRQAIDLHGATAHTFRHTFITMSSVFLDPKTLQSIAGHAKCDITLNRYAHAQQEQIAKAGEKLGDLYAVV